MPDKSLVGMTPAEKRAWRIERWRDPGIEFAGPQAAADYKARVGRVITAVELEVPDRVPVSLSAGFWPAVCAGMTPYEVMHDAAAAGRAWREFNLRFRPDTSSEPVTAAVSGRMFEMLDYRLYAWPGHGVSETASYQYNEKEWMLADEYDDLISDPSGYMLRTYLPRTVGAFAGFKGLTSLFDFIELPFVSGHVGAWGSPEMVESLAQLAGAARDARAWRSTLFSVMAETTALGFPPYRSGSTKAPFDILGDTLRGTKGVIVDMFRQPEKVIAACERLVPIAIDWVMKRPATPPTPVVFMPLHKGADGFMSDEQFRTFYWPSLLAVINGLVDEGMIPFLFAEGRFGSRLEAIMEVPRANTVWLFDQTDMARAKKTIGTVACIQGNMPISLIHAGTPEQVGEYTRRLIDDAAADGGFILDFGAIADGGKEENLEAMLTTAWEYGVY